VVPTQVWLTPGDRQRLNDLARAANVPLRQVIHDALALLANEAMDYNEDDLGVKDTVIERYATYTEDGNA
jgi:hypothetical protein